MNPYLDGAVIIDCNNDTTNNLRPRAHTLRTLAPMALHNTVIDYGLPATLFDYFYAWDNHDLMNYVVMWCKKHNVKKPLLLTSALLNARIIKPGNKLHQFVSLFRQQYPQSKYFTGGPGAMNYEQEDNIKPDAVFRGRSLHLFEHWLHSPDEPALDTITVEYDRPVYHKRSLTVTEDPIVPKLYDDYCLTENDIVSFESKLGCKFNCTFCNFEFRAAKHTTVSDAENMHEFFHTAINKYGVRYFSCVDDTFNEDDAKVDNLLEATKPLSTKPIIAGYSRFDVLKARPWQMEKLDQCGFWSHGFGIETLHREASKNIRKGIHRDDAFKFIEDELRSQYPHWWLATGMIMGIPPEPLAYFIETWDQVAQRNIFDGFYINPLGIYSNSVGAVHEETQADIYKNPEKYGITITGSVPDRPWLKNWKHEQMDFMTARTYSLRIAQKAYKRGVTLLDAWEAITRSALGIADLFDVDAKTAYRQAQSDNPQKLQHSAFADGPFVNSEFYEAANTHVNRYIKLKKNYIVSL